MKVRRQIFLFFNSCTVEYGSVLIYSAYLSIYRPSPSAAGSPYQAAGSCCFLLPRWYQLADFNPITSPEPLVFPGFSLSVSNRWKNKTHVVVWPSSWWGRRQGVLLFLYGSILCQAYLLRPDPYLVGERCFFFLPQWGLSGPYGVMWCFTGVKKVEVRIPESYVTKPGSHSCREICSSVF